VVGRLMYLVDTNVWLESILDQERAEEVRDFMRRVEGRLLAVSEFSIYSVCVILNRMKKQEACADFLTDTIADTGLLRVRLDIPDMLNALDVGKRYRLDFDDAYQYVAAESASTPTLTRPTAGERRRRKCWESRPSPGTGLRRSRAVHVSASCEPLTRPGSVLSSGSPSGLPLFVAGHPRPRTGGVQCCLTPTAAYAGTFLVPLQEAPHVGLEVAC